MIGNAGRSVRSQHSQARQGECAADRHAVVDRLADLEPVRDEAEDEGHGAQGDEGEAGRREGPSEVSQRAGSAGFGDREIRGRGDSEALTKRGQRLCFRSRAASNFHAAVVVILGSQCFESRAIALRIVSSFRDTAVSATFEALPACFKRR